MVSHYNRKKKKDAVFLNVKPIMSSTIAVRKYSNGIMDQMHNGFGKQVYQMSNNRPSIATISSTNQHFIPNIFYQNVAPLKWFMLMIGVLPMMRTGPGTTRFTMRSLPFGYCLVVFICLS
uniref:Uncharacterized protein n=4 Tax=Stomoxys calcitrans TaxID=35570 RepID=A0A454A0Q3_STOCA